MLWDILWYLFLIFIKRWISYIEIIGYGDFISAGFDAIKGIFTQHMVVLITIFDDLRCKNCDIDLVVERCNDRLSKVLRPNQQ